MRTKNFLRMAFCTMLLASVGVSCKNNERPIVTMDSIAYFDVKSEPIDKVVDSPKHIADLTFDDYGPCGIKESTSDLLLR